MIRQRIAGGKAVGAIQHQRDPVAQGRDIGRVKGVNNGFYKTLRVQPGQLCGGGFGLGLAKIGHAEQGLAVQV